MGAGWTSEMGESIAEWKVRAGALFKLCLTLGVLCRLRHAPWSYRSVHQQRGSFMWLLRTGAHTYISCHPPNWMRHKGYQAALCQQRVLLLSAWGQGREGRGLWKTYSSCIDQEVLQWSGGPWTMGCTQLHAVLLPCISLGHSPGTGKGDPIRKDGILQLPAYTSHQAPDSRAWG